MPKKRKKTTVETAAKPPEPEAPGPPGGAPDPSRTALVLGVAFFSGAALMTLEIVGGRLVAAYFGSHVFVWGALIGIFMGALSLGYYLGGRVADRYPRTRTLGVLLGAAGLAVIGVPLVGGPVCRAIAAALFTGDMELANRWNPALAILVVFSVPSVLIGSVAPFTVRLLAREVATMGRVTGRVYASNALGSITGTLFTAFLLMSFLGNTAILAATGASLLLAGIAVAVSDKPAPREPSPESPAPA